MGAIKPLRSVTRMAMAVSSGAVMTMATSRRGICAELVKARAWIYPVADIFIPSFHTPLDYAWEDEKVQPYPQWDWAAKDL